MYSAIKTLFSAIVPSIMDEKVDRYLDCNSVARAQRHRDTEIYTEQQPDASVMLSRLKGGKHTYGISAIFTFLSP